MTNTIDTYLDRVTRFHKKRPKFLGSLASVLHPIIDTQSLLNLYPNYFDIDTAIGAQLDIVGEWVNLSRDIKIPLPDMWFRWGDAIRGWGLGYWVQPYDSGTYSVALVDDDYRRLLYARILANHWDGTSGEALDILNTYFIDPDSLIIVDDKNTMQIIYAITNHIPDLVSLEIFKGNYLPLNTAGVKTYYYVTSLQDNPIFGWGLDNGSIGGWGIGAWGVDPQYFLENPSYIDSNHAIASSMFSGVFGLTGSATLTVVHN